MNSELYLPQHGLTTGFHACDLTVAEALLAENPTFKSSENAYDWLGHGMYFWENNLTRAQLYAEDLVKRKKIKEPYVIGSVLKLGYCFDLIDSLSLQTLKNDYEALKIISELSGDPLPQNSPAFSTDPDNLYRHLDCAVIEYMHATRAKAGLKPYDSVRGVFWEGNDLYPLAGFKEKNHIQLCIRNPNCIKGYFRPLDLNEVFDNV